MLDFDYDLFISYAHKDNDKLDEEPKGWIDQFREVLEKILRQRLQKKEPAIWRDDELRGNDDFDEIIFKELVRSAALVTVLSPSYISSSYCIREVEAFVEAAQETGTLELENKVRIFKVIKSPVPLEDHPPVIQRMLGYEFYRVDPTPDQPREFMVGFGDHIDTYFLAKLDDLARDIQELLERLRADAQGSAVQLPPPGGTVYLAETTFDLNPQRDQMRRELEEHGYTVLPDEQLPLYAPDFEAAVEKALQACDLSIHLVGEHYGVIPEASDQSVVALQVELAGKHSRNSQFPRLIWLPRGVSTDDDRQQEFVSFLRQDLTLYSGDELLETTLEDLKTVMHDTLSRLEGTDDDDVTLLTDDSLTRVYLICNPDEFDDIAPIDDYLFDEGFEVLLPEFDGDESDTRDAHRTNLRICDAALIYYGNGSQAWLRAKLRDLRKAVGYRDAVPITSTGVYIAGPKTRMKERFRTHEDIFVEKNYNDFSADTLHPFVTAIRQRQEEKG